MHEATNIIPFSPSFQSLSFLPDYGLRLHPFLQKVGGVSAQTRVLKSIYMHFIFNSAVSRLHDAESCDGRKELPRVRATVRFIIVQS